MKILLVDNETAHIDKLVQALNGHDIDLIKWNALSHISVQNFDVIVLSGSYRYSILSNKYVYESQIKMLVEHNRPIIGICAGFELIVDTFGGTIKKLDDKIKGHYKLEILVDDQIFSEIVAPVVYEAHRWVVDTLPQSFIPLATSVNGYQIIKHQSKLIYGFQFHPEFSDSYPAGKKILYNTLRILEQSTT